MQKKILASLLMVPMAYSAFADINITVPVNGNDWNAAGIVGDKLVYNPETQSIHSAVAPIGAGELSTVVKVAAPGHYCLSFTNLDNASVDVTGNAVTNFKKASDKDFTYNFDVTGGGRQLRNFN